MKQLIGILGVILSIILICYGFNISVPSDTIYLSASQEYVGGDAYNYIIESGLRGGEISGTITSKSIYIVGGCILLILSLVACSPDEKHSKSVQNSVSSTLNQDTNNSNSPNVNNLSVKEHFFE